MEKRIYVALHSPPVSVSHTLDAASCSISPNRFTSIMNDRTSFPLADNYTVLCSEMSCGLAFPGVNDITTRAECFVSVC